MDGYGKAGLSAYLIMAVLTTGLLIAAMVGAI